MAEYKNMSYLGFSFNGIHSSDFKLYRISQGDRYTTNINGNYEDKTKHIKGQQGVYYFGTTLRDLKLQIPVAFSEVKESELSALTEWCNNGLVGELVLDEAPYKAYWARFDGVQNMSTLCFDEQGENIYKGEMTFNFVCYEPHAHSTFKYLDEYKYLMGSEIGEWRNSVNLLNSPQATEYINLESVQIGKITDAGGTQVQKVLYNPGDFPIYPDIYLTIKVGTNFKGIRLRSFTIQAGPDKQSELYISSNFLANVTYKFHIDARTKVITCLQGDNSDNRPGIFNDKIYSWNGVKDAFVYEPQDQIISSDYTSNIRMSLSLSSGDSGFPAAIDLSNCNIEAKYNYYYK